MENRDSRRWTGWIKAFSLAALGVAGTLFGFVALLDPYGVRVEAGESPRPLMDLNQRFMYPQLVRSGAFDSAIIGTSTIRLLDPAILSQGLQARFVNLGMNAATPWEQVQIAALFARKTAAPKLVIWGIDLPWCEADATSETRKLTPRPFPPWLYDDSGWNDWAKQLNFTTLEIAVRLAGNRFGLVPPRIRGDGYEVFTPPEASYDLDRARFHLYRGSQGKAPEIAPLVASDEAFSAANALILRNTALVNFLDGCAASLPMHQNGEPPCGLSLAAPGGHDARLLSLALAVEKALSRAAP